MVRAGEQPAGEPTLRVPTYSAFSEICVVHHFHDCLVAQRRLPLALIAHRGGLPWDEGNGSSIVKYSARSASADVRLRGIFGGWHRCC